MGVYNSKCQILTVRIRLKRCKIKYVWSRCRKSRTDTYQYYTWYKNKVKKMYRSCPVIEDDTRTFLICSLLALSPFIIGLVVHFVAIFGFNRNPEIAPEGILQQQEWACVGQKAIYSRDP